MSNIFIIDIDIKESDRSILEIDKFDDSYMDRVPIYMSSKNTTNLTIECEVIHANFYLVIDGKRYTYGFSEKVKGVLNPFIRCIEDQSRDYHVLNSELVRERKTNKETTTLKSKIIEEYAKRIDNLRSSWWLRLKFLFNNKMSFPDGQS